MKQHIFNISLLTITVLGLVLRLVNYAQIPSPAEAFDELHYAWGGVTWIKQGIPKSWSWFDSYSNHFFVEKFGTKFKIVWPLLEKPPLYFLLSGMSVLPSARSSDIYEIPHYAIRILPLLLSVITILATGVLGKQLFSPILGLLASLLYATTPQIVLANRLSVTENLLTPLSLLSLIIFLKKSKSKNWTTTQPIFLAILTALSFLTKQIGISVGIGLMTLYFLQNKRKQIVIICTGLVIGIFLYLGFGFIYDGNLFLSLQSDVRHAHTLKGLPETIFSIFRYQGISSQDKSFLDGTMLLGLILLLSAPLWLSSDLVSSRHRTLLIFPFIYLILMVLGESGSHRDSYFGWYLYPLYPFMVLILAKFMSDLWQRLNIWHLWLLLVFLGTSSIRFLFMHLPLQYQHLWQYLFIGLIVGNMLLWNKQSGRFKKMLLTGLFLVYISINLLTIINLGQSYL